MNWVKDKEGYNLGIKIINGLPVQYQIHERRGQWVLRKSEPLKGYDLKSAEARFLTTDVSRELVGKFATEEEAKKTAEGEE